MAEVVGSAAVEVGKCAWPHLKEHVGYLMHFNDNVKNLKNRVQDLMARKEHIDRLVSPDHSNGEEETPEVRLWLTRAAEMIQEAATIQQKVAEDKGCLHCLNLRWRYSISKQAKQMTGRIDKHCDDGKEDKMKMTMPPSLPTVIYEEAPSIEGLPSVESSLEEVMRALRDANTKIIGVWGMGGVGKTTLVKNVNNKLQGTRQFKKVIMVTVSKDVNIKNIQGDIAERLGFTLQDGTESSRAHGLRSRLSMKEETFLIILDDLWERLDLVVVGIPSPTSHTGCKIIFTTREKEVCKRMQSNVDIEVKVLSKEESEKLFKERAGVVVDRSSPLYGKAMEVLKECAGLPLAINVLGTTLRNEKSPEVWDNALSQMKMSAPEDFDYIKKEVYQSIKFSYDRLKDELKPWFLFCCLFPEDYDIHVDQMIHMWKGEGFLADHESLEVAKERGHTWVRQLISSCLLLESSEEGHVKMHDIVRDVGIWISSNECKDYKSFVGIPQKGLSHEKNWEEYKRISLWRCGINKLPEGMHCRKLLTLMMPENKQLTEIQGWFWEATKDLRVLDLSRTAISKIPVLSNLVNLRVLCLMSCEFEEGNCLSALGGLKQLQFLDLSFNKWLCELPNEIGELVNLRSLDLTNTDNLKIVPSGVISRLTLLEELKMWNSFQEWKAEEKDASSSSSSNAYLSEVASLKELSNLHLCIVEVERFPQDYPLIKHLTKLKKFCFCICPRPEYHSYPGSNRNELRYMEIVGCSLIPEWALMLLPQTTHLKLKECKGQDALNRDGGFPSLKSLTVEECDDVEFVVSAKESPENAFGNLQTLRLRELPNLKKVVTKYEEGLLPTHLLHNLKELTVKKCPELKHLLPSVLLQGMDNLTDVRVSDCEGMEHLFDGPPTVEQRNDVLSKLETLYLSNLTSIASVWPMGLVVNLQNLASLNVLSCHGLKKSVVSAMQMKGGLPNLCGLTVIDCKGVEEIISDVVDNEGLLPKLENLRLWRLPELVRIYGGGEAVPPPQLDWHSLKKIDVYECPKLKKVLPLQGMDNLTEVQVSNCRGMEHLFDGPPTVELHNDVLSKLETLYLSNLTSMTSIWPMGLVVNLQNLASLNVLSCHGLKKSVVSAMQMKGGLPNLVKLSVYYCGGVEEIISDVVDNEGLLPKLENLILTFLPELVRIYGGGEADPPPQLDWHSLKEIDVSKCPKLKKVQPLQGGADSVVDLSRTAISKIPVLSNLVNLRVLCLMSCEFEEGNCLSALGGLKQLQFLDLSFNKWLCELPNEIGELVNLRSLDLTNTDNLKIVPSGVISRLTLLEELKMWNSFQEWKAEEKDASSSSSSNAYLSEVASLKELSNLHLCIVEVERFPQDYPLIKHLTKLKKFCFCICPRPEYHSYPESNRNELRYMEIVGCSLIPEWALMLLPQTTDLKLEECKGQEALNRGGGFPSLKSLTVEKCDDVEFVVSAKESPENAFGNLQSLELTELRNIKKVVTKYEEGLLPTLLFHNLETVDVFRCPELKHLLPSVLLQGMDNLTDVRVSDCEGMEHLFDGPPTVEQRNDVLSKLRRLYLSGLTCMTSIWPMGLVVNLQKLATLNVWDCHGLKKVLSSNQMKGGLPNLEYVRVSDCNAVEEIISDVVDHEGLLPKLSTLNLSDLPKLVRICGGEADPLLQLDWNSLEQIRVSRCGGMEHVFDGPPTDVFFKLKTSNLRNLITLVLWRCHFFKKTVMSSVQMKGGLPNLVNLTVDDCGGVEEIISDVVDNEGLLPKLEYLKLYSLPELVRIYGGGEAVPPLQLDWHSLTTIEVYGCPKLKKVQPLQGGALKEIKGERNWWEGLDWEGDDRIISQFHSLFKEVNALVQTDDEDEDDED